MSPLFAHSVYALLWLSFGAGHSALAAPAGRGLLERHFGAGHRFAFNLIAVAHLLIVVFAGHRLFAAAPLYDLPVGLWLLAWAAEIAGWGLMLIGLRQYDGARLLGLRPDSDGETLSMTGPHRYVRHPLYAAGFLILWGGVRGPFGLATAVWASLYLLLGSWLEERKLIRLHGDTYRYYRSRVPAFVPWRGRVRL